MAKRFGDKFSRLDRIPACDRQTDIPITDILPQHILRAMHTRRAVKTEECSNSDDR